MDPGGDVMKHDCKFPEACLRKNAKQMCTCMVTDEMRLAGRRIMKQLWADPYDRDLRMHARLHVGDKAKRNAAISEGMKKKWQDPEYRAKRRTWKMSDAF
jgi:hypothetical protein